MTLASHDSDAPDYEALARQAVRFMPRLRRFPPHDPDGKPLDGPPCGDAKASSHPHPPFPSDLRDASRGAPIVLALLANEEEPVTPGRIGALTGLSKGRVSNIVSSLEAKGYVEKAPAPHDARSVVVSLTSKGAAFTDVHKQAVLNHTTQLLRQLGPRDARDAVRILGHLCEIMDESGGCAGTPCDAEATASEKEAR